QCLMTCRHTGRSDGQVLVRMVKGHCTNLRIVVYSSTARSLAELRHCYTELQMDSVVRRMPLSTDLDLIRSRLYFFAVRPCLQQPGCSRCSAGMVAVFHGYRTST